MKIEYNKPFEVTPAQYGRLLSDFSGIVAGRKENGKCYIKVWFMRYAPLIEKLLS